MSVVENKQRLDNHAERLRRVEVRIGENGIVSQIACRARHSTQEARMDKLERRVTSFDARLWLILLGQVGVIVGLIVKLVM